MKKVIRFGLSAMELNRAMRALDRFQTDFAAKVEIFRQRVGEEIAAKASELFAPARMDDIVGGSTRSPDVTVSVRADGAVTVVAASGVDAVWVEFGAGVYHNGAAGSSPHPSGNALGLTIGSYGVGHGKQTAWGYYDGGQLVITRGTPASMPMYNAAVQVAADAVRIAREVFS